MLNVPTSSRAGSLPQVIGVVRPTLVLLDKFSLGLAPIIVQENFEMVMQPGSSDALLTQGAQHDFLSGTHQPARTA
jgi:hypothetical protein